MTKKLKPEEVKRGPTYLRAWRKFRKLTGEEVAERLDIDRTTISRIERGLYPYNQDFLEKAATLYGCEPEDLLMIDPLKPDPPKLVYDRLRAVDPVMQRRALDVLEALLKAG